MDTQPNQEMQLEAFRVRMSIILERQEDETAKYIKTEEITINEMERWSEYEKLLNELNTYLVAVNNMEGINFEQLGEYKARFDVVISSLPSLNDKNNTPLLAWLRNRVSGPVTYLGFVLDQDPDSLGDDFNSLKDITKEEKAKIE